MASARRQLRRIPFPRPRERSRPEAQIYPRAPVALDTTATSGASSAARKRQAEERLAFGQGYGSGEYVASDEAGQCYHPNLLTFRRGRMLDELGIKRVRLHDARVL